MNVRYLIVAGSMFLGVASSFAQPALKTDFFPLAKGYQWTYLASEPKMPSGKARRVTVTVDREEPYVEKKLEKDNTTTTKKYGGFLLKSVSGDKTTFDHVVVMPDGVHRLHTAGTPLTPPLLFFKLGIKPGETWEANSTSGNTTIKGTFTIGSDRVKVPLDSFDAIRVSFRGDKTGDDRVEIDNWFAKGVGMVKQHIRAKNHEIVLDLEKFEKK